MNWPGMTWEAGGQRWEAAADPNSLRARFASPADVARHAQRSALAAVIHASEHHTDCAGQCHATAERVLEHLETTR